MRNYVQRGDVVTLVTDTSGARSGDVLKVGSLIGVVAADALPSSDVEVQLVGVFTLPKVGDDIDLGAAIYWNGAACTTTQDSNTLLGAATEAAGTGAATVKVRLNGVAV